MFLSLDKLRYTGLSTSAPIHCPCRSFMPHVQHVQRKSITQLHVANNNK
jgi:hypothetical protein